MFGFGWEQQEVREYLTSFSQDQQRELEFRDLTWRLGPPQEASR